MFFGTKIFSSRKTRPNLLGQQIEIIRHFYILPELPPPHVCVGVEALFSDVGMVSFWVQAQSAVLFNVLLGRSCPYDRDSFDVIVVPLFLGAGCYHVSFHVVLSNFLVMGFIFNCYSDCAMLWFISLY